MKDDSDIRGSSVSSSPTKKSVSVTYNNSTIFKILAVVLIAGLAFWLGTIYGNHHSRSTSSNFSTTRNGRFGGFHGGFGTVSSISATSITISNRSGSTTSYTINSSTKILDNGQSASYTSIADGDRVIIMPSSTSSTTASEIIVNPSFGGFNGGGNVGSSSAGSNTTGSATTQ